MQVFIHPESGPALELTGADPAEGVDAAQDVAETMLRIHEGVQFPDITVEDGQNNRRTITFAVTREHASPGLAALYWMDHESAVPRTGAVQFIIKEPGGATVAQRWMRNAGISTRRGTWSGCATTHTYTIIGGRIYPTRT